MMTTVTIYHNVEHDCWVCRQPVIRLGAGEWAHLHQGADHMPAAAFPAGRFGYQPGHAMVPVFRADVTDGRAPEAVAQRIAGALDPVPAVLGSEDRGLASDYRSLRLRPLVAGDVIDVGGTLLAKARSGFAPVTGKIRLSWVAWPGTVPLPHCARCHAIAGPAELEALNMAGGLACRDVVACADRANAPRG